MLNNSLEHEIKKNSNSVFVSKDLEDLIEYDKLPTNIFDANLFLKEKTLKCKILSYSSKNNKTYIKLHVNTNKITDVILDSLKGLDVGNKVISYDFGSSLISHKIYLNKKNKVVLKVELEV